MSIRTATPMPVPPSREVTRPAVDLARVPPAFPILAQKIPVKPRASFDNAATAQKPRAVLDALGRYYTHDNANVHRGVHLLSERATHEYEEARARAQRFLNAAEPREILFVRGTTEGINLV